MSLAVAATRGAVWTILASVGSRLIGVAGTLILTHFLAPEVVGEVAVASIVVLTANQLSVIGFGQYVVAHPNADRRATFHATAYNFLLAGVALTAVLLFRDNFAPIFDAPRMAGYVPGLVLAAAVQRVGFIPSRVLARDMRFGTVAAAQALGELTYTATSVALAAAGLGGDAIVWGNIGRAAVAAAIFLGAANRPDWLSPTPLTRARTRELFRFGVPLSVGALAQFASRRWDNLLFSRMFGPAKMGLYNLAYNLADIPATHIGEHIGDVLLPSFARLEGPQRERALIRSTALLALVVFPVAVGLGAVAPTLVAVAFNAEWQGVAPFLVVLCMLSVARPVGWTISSYLQARHRTAAVMSLEIFKVAALLTSVAGLGAFGPVSASVGVGVAFAAHAAASIAVVWRIDRIAPARIVPGLVRPLIACAPMVVVVVVVRRSAAALGVGATPGTLAVEVAAGGAAYAVSAWAVARAATRDLIGTLRRSYARPVTGDGD